MYYYVLLDTLLGRTMNINDSRVAIGLFGISYKLNYTHWMPDWSTTIDYTSCCSSVKSLFPKNSFFYLSTYFSDKLSHIVDTYNPVACYIENDISKLEFKNLENNFQKRNCMFNECLDIISPCDKYDYIILTRFDLLFSLPINTLTIDNAKINFLNRASWGYNTNMVDDNFYIIPANIFPFFRHRIKQSNNSNTAHEYHLLFDQSEYNFMQDGNFYSHEQPFYKIQRG